MGIAAAIIGSALIGAGASYAGQRKQQKAMEEQQARAEEAQRIAEEEAKARQTQLALDEATSESATTNYGLSKDTKKQQTASDLLIKPNIKNVSIGTGTSNRTGLGF